MPNEYKSKLSPSKDIVKRLKAKPPKGFVTSPLMIEAADEIERLQKEVMAWWEETELMRSDLAVYSFEIERLRQCLKYEENRSNRIGTHSEGCWGWGPRHYECAVREIERLRIALERAADSLHDYHAIDAWAEACEALGEKK